MKILSMVRAIDIDHFIDVSEKFGSMLCRMLQVVLVGAMFVLLFIFSVFYLNSLFKMRQRLSEGYLVHVYFWVGVFMLYAMVFNYTMAYRMGPGHPDQLAEKALRRNRVWYRCKKCNSLKPIRTHHCSVCDRCVLQMDHHCPWMGTCIGQQNRAYFVRFLTYLAGSCLLVTHLITDLSMPHEETYVFLIAIFWAIGSFALYHWVIILLGRTTLETCKIFDGYRPATWHFAHNLTIVFGTSNPLLIFLPIATPFQNLGCEWNLDSPSSSTTLASSSTTLASSSTSPPASSSPSSPSTSSASTTSTSLAQATPSPLGPMRIGEEFEQIQNSDTQTDEESKALWQQQSASIQ